MKEYLRTGEIPKDERSLNYLCKEKEKGVSVFNIENGLPVLRNLRLLSSYCTRIEKSHYIVTGKEVGIGNDGEPLLKNVIILKKQEIDVPERCQYIHSIFNKIFSDKKYIVNQEITFDHTKPDEFRDYHTYQFNGYLYSNPCCKEFDYSLGFVPENEREMLNDIPK